MTVAGTFVLVVDGDKIVRRHLAEQLESHRFVVATVADGLQALRALHHRQFDAVITDLQVRYLDGLDLLRQCRLVWPELPVILISSNLVDNAARLVMAQGAAACLPKPVDPGNLIQVLREAITHTSVSQSGQAYGGFPRPHTNGQQHWSVGAKIERDQANSCKIEVS